MKTRKQRGGIMPFEMKKVTRTCPIKRYRHPNNCVPSSYQILGILDDREARELSRLGKTTTPSQIITLLNKRYPGSNFRFIDFICP